MLNTGILIYGIGNRIRCRNANLFEKIENLDFKLSPSPYLHFSQANTFFEFKLYIIFFRKGCGGGRGGIGKYTIFLKLCVKRKVSRYWNAEIVKEENINEKMKGKKRTIAFGELKYEQNEGSDNSKFLFKKFPIESSLLRLII